MIVDQIRIPKCKLNSADEGMLECDIRLPINPISKNTFDALPKIYGRRKKKIYMPNQQVGGGKIGSRYLQEFDHKIYPSSMEIEKELKEKYQKSMFKEKNHDESNGVRYKTQMKSYNKELSNKLSKPKSQICNKRYCFCNQVHEKSPKLEKHRSLTTKNIDHKLTSVKFPNLNQEDTTPFESQTKHKVIIQSQAHIMNKSIKGASFGLLQLLRKNNERNSQNSRMSGHQKIKNQFNQTKEFPSQMMMTQKQKSFNSSKNQGVQSTTIKISKIQPNNPLYQGDENIKSRSKNSRARFISENSDDADDKSVSSISSVSLSKYIFQNDGKQKTMFSSLNKKAGDSHIKAKQKEIREKFNYQNKNGLFVIPEQDDYTSFLKDYEPMSEKFQIKKLVRLPKFKVLKEDDGVYFGEVQNQMKEGKGLKVTEKQIFQGKFKNNVKITGYQRNIDGVYKGEFINGLRDGHGTFEWNNGQIFEGEWKNGMKNGFGTWKSPKGDHYEGQWAANRQNGIGTFRHKLSTYKGSFLNFLKHGGGQQIFSNGDKYQGQYKEGKPYGKGKYQWADGSYYEGQFSGGCRQGHGKWSFINGTTYIGQFHNDFKHGKGKQTYKTGQYYEGEFNNGNKSNGTLYDSEGNAIQIKSC